MVHQPPHRHTHTHTLNIVLQSGFFCLFVFLCQYHVINEIPIIETNKWHKRKKIIFFNWTHEKEQHNQVMVRFKHKMSSIAPCLASDCDISTGQLTVIPQMVDTNASSLLSDYIVILLYIFQRILAMFVLNVQFQSASNIKHQRIHRLACLGPQITWQMSRYCLGPRALRPPHRVAFLSTPCSWLMLLLWTTNYLGLTLSCLNAGSY